MTVTLRRLAGLLLLAGCGPRAGEQEPAENLVDEDTVTATISEDVVTVAFVAAETTEDASVTVEYGLDETYGASAPATAAGTTHAVTLLGLRAETTYHYRLVATGSDGTTTTGSDHTLTTGELPDGVPAFEMLDAEVDGTWGDFTLLATETDLGENGGAFIVDDAGEVVWYWMGEAVDWAEITPDGRVMLLLHDGLSWPEASLLLLPLDGTEPLELRAGLAHHAAAQPPDVLAATVTADKRDVDGVNVQGDSIVEHHGDGTTRTVWDAWSTLPIEEHEGWEAIEGGSRDWTHANGLFYADDAYYVSLYWLETILKVDRATGQIVWRFGGGGQFAMAEEDEPGHLHAPEILPDGRLAFFDNGHAGGSAIVIYTLDEATMTATRDAALMVEEGRVAAVMGEVDALPDESFFTTWGDMRQIAVLGPEGDLRWRVEAAEIGLVLGQGQRLQTLYAE